MTSQSISVVHAPEPFWPTNSTPLSDSMNNDINSINQGRFPSHSVTLTLLQMATTGVQFVSSTGAIFLDQKWPISPPIVLSIDDTDFQQPITSYAHELCCELEFTLIARPSDTPADMALVPIVYGNTKSLVMFTQDDNSTMKFDAVSVFSDIYVPIAGTYKVSAGVFSRIDYSCLAKLQLPNLVIKRQMDFSTESQHHPVHTPITTRLWRDGIIRNMTPITDFGNYYFRQQWYNKQHQEKCTTGSDNVMGLVYDKQWTSQKNIYSSACCDRPNPPCAPLQHIKDESLAKLTNAQGLFI